jgi:protein-S-isoprenylcysteine O-methyltransferase Ste14
MTPETAMSTVWGAWVLSWIVASAWSGRTVKRAGLGDELSYRILIVAGAALTFAFRPASRGLGNRIYPPPPVAANWVLVALVALGCLFAWWARLHLGSLWSSNVTRKADHRIVDTGPYRIVRHPIYTGLIFALLATAAALGTPTGFAGVALMIAGIVMKARLEEKFLREEFGPEIYDAYARRVPMLVPMWPKGG